MTIILLFIINSIIAQDFQGSVTYKTHRKVNIATENSKVDSDIQKQINDMVAKQFQKEYTLQFNPIESIYKEDISLDAPKAQMEGLEIVIAGSSGSDILYKNIKEKRYTSHRDMFGKMFLVKDKLKDNDWKLEQETKKIGNYTCFKATTTRKMQKFAKIIEIDSDNKESKKPEEPKEVEVTITAWYTPEIPIANGPGLYSGLPGLILEVNDGEQTILCNKVVLNPKKKIKVLEPKKGKVVTEERFEIIMEKKLKEMEDRMPHGGDGKSIEFRIGG